jgi:hypothetical protein
MSSWRGAGWFFYYFIDGFPVFAQAGNNIFCSLIEQCKKTQEILLYSNVMQMKTGVAFFGYI